MKCIGMVAGLVIVALLVVSCEWGEADLADGTPEKRKLMERKSMSATAAKPGDARPHPRLYFGEDDIDALRLRMEHPRFKRDWDAIMRRAEKALDGPLIDKGIPSEVLARAAGAAARCAFVYRLTGEERFGRRAREICEAVLEADGWTGDFFGKKKKDGARFHLRTAAICQGLALAYDMLAPEMSEAERKRFAETCYEKALKAFLEECRGRSNPYLNGRRTMNWLAVLSSGAGCLFIALDGDSMDFTREIEIARAHILRFIEWYDDDGSALEHGSYWSYGMGNALHFLKALKENGWRQIMHQASRKLDRMAYPILYGCIGGKHVVNFCDDTYGPLGARDNALVLAAEFRDARLQWWADQLPAADAFGFIAANPDLEPSPPDDLPTCMVFGRTGIGVMRESMTDPDTRLLALKAGRARGRIFDDPHCQFDLNSVVLDAFGVTLLADPGYGHDWSGSMSTCDPKHHTNATPPHNTVLIDGRGQEVQWSPIASLDDLSPSKDVDYIVSRIEQGYGPKVTRFDRHAYFVDKRFYVLLDDIELTASARLTWNFHGPKNAQLTETAPATITNGAARLRVVPQSAVELACSKQDDHVLPRLQWDTVKKAKAARVAWVLLPERTNVTALPSIELHDEFMLVTDGTKTWRLPIVRRRAPHKSSMTLIRGR